MTIRAGRPADLPSLLAVEAACFAGDRLDRRKFARFLRSTATATLLVSAKAHGLDGYVLALFRARSSLARLYSLAVVPDARRHGVAATLLAAAERTARRRGCTEIRLEVRPDNAAAIAFYARRGYVRFGTYAGFYDDGADALRMHKPL
jgi:ribosomal protein S18 acetylase RimI-like enzyme